MEFTLVLWVKFVKSVNNLIVRESVQIDTVYNEDYHIIMVMWLKISIFVRSVTFLNIIYLLKNYGI